MNNLNFFANNGKVFLRISLSQKFCKFKQSSKKNLKFSVQENESEWLYQNIDSNSILQSF